LLDDRCLKVANQYGVRTQSEASLKEILVRTGTQLIEPNRDRKGPFLLHELVERRTAPAGLRALQQANDRLWIRGGGRSPAEQLETPGVNGAGRGLQQVARRPGEDLGFGPEESSQAREMALENCSRIRRLAVTPQLLTDPIG
jgi:hypothetical protein